jgi:hypothetical protein
MNPGQPFLNPQPLDGVWPGPSTSPITVEPDIGIGRWLIPRATNEKTPAQGA